MSIIPNKKNWKKKDSLSNKEHPTPSEEGEQVRRNPQNHSKGKNKKEQMISLQNLLTTRTPSVTSLALPTTVEELVSKSQIFGLWWGSWQLNRTGPSYTQHSQYMLVLLECFSGVKRYRWPWHHAGPKCRYVDTAEPHVLPKSWATKVLWGDSKPAFKGEGSHWMLWLDSRHNNSKISDWSAKAPFTKFQHPVLSTPPQLQIK